MILCKRLGAFFVDLAIFSLCALAFGITLQRNGFSWEQTKNIILICFYVSLIVYFFICWYKNKGQTIGGMFARIRVVSVDNRDLSLKMAAWKAVIMVSMLYPWSYWYSLVGGALGCSVLLTPIGRKDQQTFWDVVSRSKVIEVREIEGG